MTSAQYAELYDLVMDGYRARLRDPSLGGAPTFCIVTELANALRDDETAKFHLGIHDSHERYISQFKEDVCAVSPTASADASRTSGSAPTSARSLASAS